MPLTFNLQLILTKKMFFVEFYIKLKTILLIFKRIAHIFKS